MSAPPAPRFQRRVLLATALLKSGARQLGPGRADEKERLFAKLEEGAWDLPDALFESPLDDEAWLDAALSSAEAKALLDRSMRADAA